jgi:hypothetical protein
MRYIQIRIANISSLLRQIASNKKAYDSCDKQMYDLKACYCPRVWLLPLVYLSDFRLWHVMIFNFLKQQFSYFSLQFNFLSIYTLILLAHFIIFTLRLLLFWDFRIRHLLLLVYFWFLLIYELNCW